MEEQDVLACSMVYLAFWCAKGIGAWGSFLDARKGMNDDQSQQKPMRIIPYHIFILLLQGYHVCDLKHPEG